MSIKKILVVDDELGIRELLRDILIDEGFEIFVAENATEARELKKRMGEAAEKEKEALLVQARTEAQQLVTDAKKEIEQSVEKARVDLQKQTAKLAIDLSSRLIKKNIDPQLNEQLITETLDKR